jgi:hypothetical protein
MNENENVNNEYVAPRWNREENPWEMSNRMGFPLSEDRLEGSFTMSSEKLLDRLKRLGVVEPEQVKLLLPPEASAQDPSAMLTIAKRPFVYQLRRLGVYEEEIDFFFGSYML